MASESYMQKQLAEMNSRELTERGKELGNYVQDLYTAGAKMFTKDMFRDIETELAKDPRPKTVMMRSMNDVIAPSRIPLEADYPLRADHLHPSEARQKNNEVLLIGPHFRLYQTMVHAAKREESLSNPTDEEIDDKTLVSRALVLRSGTMTASSVGYEELKSVWEKASHNWKQSTVCTELSAILSDNTISKLSKIVCFGLGSLTDPSGIWALPNKEDGLPRCNPMTQHAAALTMATVLGKKFGTEPLPILAQDPIYTAADKRLLAEIGIQVVGGYGSLAFTEVDEECLVFSVHPNIPVKQVVSDIARPGAMIWNRVQPVEEEKTEYYMDTRRGSAMIVSPWSTDQDSPRTRKLVEDYLEIDFPPSQRFGDLKIYIRKD